MFPAPASAPAPAPLAGPSRVQQHPSVVAVQQADQHPRGGHAASPPGSAWSSAAQSTREPPPAGQSPCLGTVAACSQPSLPAYLHESVGGPVREEPASKSDQAAAVDLTAADEEYRMQMLRWVASMPPEGQPRGGARLGSQRADASLPSQSTGGRPEAEPDAEGAASRGDAMAGSGSACGISTAGSDGLPAMGGGSDGSGAADGTEAALERRRLALAQVQNLQDRVAAAMAGDTPQARRRMAQRAQAREARRQNREQLREQRAEAQARRRGAAGARRRRGGGSGDGGGAGDGDGGGDDAGDGGGDGDADADADADGHTVTDIGV